MKTKVIAGSLGLIAAATLLIGDGAHARRFGSHYGGAYETAGFDYQGARTWDAAAAARVEAKAAARARYDARDPDFLHRCYQPQRIWNGGHYTWRLVSIC